MAKMLQDLKHSEIESGEVMEDSQVPCLVNAKRKSIDRRRKNLDVSYLELAMGIATCVKITSNFCTEVPGIK